MLPLEVSLLTWPAERRALSDEVRVWRGSIGGFVADFSADAPPLDKRCVLEGDLGGDPPVRLLEDSAVCFGVVWLGRLFLLPTSVWPTFLSSFGGVNGLRLME